MKNGLRVVTPEGLPRMIDADTLRKHNLEFLRVGLVDTFTRDGRGLSREGILGSLITRSMKVPVPYYNLPEQYPGVVTIDSQGLDCNDLDDIHELLEELVRQLPTVEPRDPRAEYLECHVGAFCATLEIVGYERPSKCGFQEIKDPFVLPLTDIDTFGRKVILTLQKDSTPQAA